MALTDGYNPSTLQFVIDALRTASSPTSIDLTTEIGRKKIATEKDVLQSNGHKAVRNNDGTGMTIAQIATAANMTTAQVTELAGRL
jgi:hypothetical protein